MLPSLAHIMQQWMTFAICATLKMFKADPEIHQMVIVVLERVNTSNISRVTFTEIIIP